IAPHFFFILNFPVLRCKFLIFTLYLLVFIRVTGIGNRMLHLHVTFAGVAMNTGNKGSGIVIFPFIPVLPFNPYNRMQGTRSQFLNGLRNHRMRTVNTGIIDQVQEGASSLRTGGNHVIGVKAVPFGIQFHLVKKAAAAPLDSKPEHTGIDCNSSAAPLIILYINFTIIIQSGTYILTELYSIVTSLFTEKEYPYPLDAVIRRLPGRYLGYLRRDLLSPRIKHPYVIRRIEFSFRNGQSEHLRCSLHVI